MDRSSLDRTICLLPPSIPGSIGDEKVVRTCIQQLRGEHITVLNYEDGSWDSLIPEAKSVSLFGSHESTAYYRSKGLRKILFISRTLLGFAIQLPSLIRTLWNSKRFIVLGMDIMDGHYGVLSALHKAVLAYGVALMGIKVDIINCSFNKHPSRIMVWALRWLPRSVRIVAREPSSHARMEQFLSRPITLAADISFLFTVDTNRSNQLTPTEQWIKSERTKGQTIIGMNIADNKNYDCETLKRMCAETIRSMKDASFVLIPHAKYKRPNLPNEIRLMESIVSLLTADDAARCHVLQIPCDVSDLQRILQLLDFGLVGRMHLAIGMAVACVPVCCIGYQNKFDGLFRDYLHSPELLLPMDRCINEGSFTSILSDVLLRKDEHVRKFTEALPGLRELARKNF